MKHLKKLDHEMITFLQNYVQINTAQPNPDYKKACALFKAQANKDGFAYQEIVLSSGNPVLIITYNGSNPALPALALNHHMDVVPAPNTTNWIAPPFSGEIHDNAIIGRGIQDMKGVGVAHYFALKSLKDAGIKPERTIHLFAVPDEEVGGFKGTKEFVEATAFKQLNIGYVIDEGNSSGNAKKLNIKVAERKPLQIRITGKGALAHGSKLQSHNIVHELIQMLHYLILIHQKQQQQAETTPPGRLLSMNITSFQAGTFIQGKTTLNVIPETATATIDIRIPPSMKIENVKQIVEETLAAFPNIEYQIEATVNDYSSDQNYETPLYTILAQTINEFDLQPTPFFSEGTTDLRYYLERGIQGVGITPFTIKDNIHGTNESLPLEDLVQGKNIITQFIKNFCVTMVEES